MATVRELLQRVTDWAGGRSDVRALVLVGSQARGTARPDSDVDLVVLSTTPSELVANRNWTGVFGVVRREAIEDWGGLRSVRVWYQDAPEVEFGITGVEWAAAGETTLEVLTNGYQVLLDRMVCFGLTAPIRSASSSHRAK
jgi:predicted nucleotidyltransferase